jgi:hypothetical protein
VQYRFEVDVLLAAISKSYRNPVWANDAECDDSMDGMPHDSPEWFDLDGRLAGLQELPVVLQLRAMYLGPSFDEPLLRLGETPAEAFDRVHGEHGGVLLVVRMEMRSVVLPGRLDEHPDDDPIEARDLRHASFVVRVVVGLTRV